MSDEVKKYPFFDENLSEDERVQDLLSRLTLEEKFTIMAGHKLWWTPPIKRLGIPRLGMSDGPRGISWHSSFAKNTQFPVPKTMAATWDPTWTAKFGEAVAEEIRARKKHILLAPGINLDRTPLNGRTFEYFSEDPILIREMIVPLVKGVQKHRIAACLKHYVANNQEHNRRNVSAEIDERTLRETYLKPFEQIIKESDPWSIMSCYNRVNGEFGSASRILLQDYLVDAFGFSGFVMTDWGATQLVDNPEEGINAGLSLEMPFPKIYNIEKMKTAFEAGKFTEERLNELVEKLLKIMVRTGVFDTNLPAGAVNTKDHQILTKDMAIAGMVLLKNENNILPLQKTIKSVAIIGANAKKKFGKFLYGGSSAVIPPFEITPYKGIKQYLRRSVKIVSDPAQADVALVITGLNHDVGMDAESGDKFNLTLPSEEEDLILDTVTKNPNTVVVLINGSPIAMENWIDNVPAVLEAWYPGMMGGLAIAETLFGDVNPSGKLPITFPKALNDSPAHKSELTYPGTGQYVDEKITVLGILKRIFTKPKKPDDSWKDSRVVYEEGIYIGYRHFDKENIDPLFPFGFGLSYTKFKLENISLDKQTVKKNETFSVSLDISNIGEREGAEVVQVYSSDLECSVDRPPKELIGFQKVHVKPGEKKNITIPLRASDFAFFDIETHDWKVEAGQFKLFIGTSSRDFLFETMITVE